MTFIADLLASLPPEHRERIAQKAREAMEAQMSPAEILMEKVTLCVAAGLVLKEQFQGDLSEDEQKAAARTIGTLLACLEDMGETLQAQMPKMAATIPDKMKAIRQVGQMLSKAPR